MTLEEKKETQPVAAVSRLRVRFSRTGAAAGLSHLEQIKAFRKIVQDSGLPFACGGSRRSIVKMSFGPAIAVGYESLAEYADIYLRACVTCAQAAAALGKGAAGGLAVAEVRKIPLGFPSVEALVNVAEYKVEGDFSHAPTTPEQFLGQGRIVIDKVKPSGALESIDARPLIRELCLSQDGTVRLLLRFGPKKNLKPERILQKWLDRPVCAAPGGFSIIRKQLYWEDASGALNAP